MTAAQPSSATPATPVLRWHPTETKLVVEAEGLTREQLQAFVATSRSDEERARLLAVHVVPLDLKETSPVSRPLPPAAGAWSVVEGKLRFELRFPPAQGVHYRAELNLPGRPVVVAEFEPARRSMVPTTVVTQIFPTSDVLPENQLKFYVQFSAPMSRGDVYRHVQLRNAEGQAIEFAFLELDEELWDLPMTRLTLLIDPGRIKRGVKPLEDIGPVFETGKTYTLVVEKMCVDAEGRQLRETFAKTFRVGPPDRTAPDPTLWKIAAPSAGSRHPLVVEFGEPMDQALALRLITVVAETPSASRIASTAVEGNAALGSAERQWNFLPATPWRPGRYRLVVSPTIEDLAGNNIGKTFDVDLVGGGTPRMSEEPVSVRFEVK